MSVHLGIPEVQETAIPAREHVKFYQVGSYAVGNRLAEEDYRSLQSDPNRWNTLTSGHRACQGCGEALGARYALDSAAAASGGDIVAVNATGCLEVFSTRSRRGRFPGCILCSATPPQSQPGPLRAWRPRGRRLGSSPRAVTAEPLTSAWVAYRACSNAMTMSCTSATTIRRT